MFLLSQYQNTSMVTKAEDNLLANVSFIGKIWISDCVSDDQSEDESNTDSDKWHSSIVTYWEHLFRSIRI